MTVFAVFRAHNGTHRCPILSLAGFDHGTATSTSVIATFELAYQNLLPPPEACTVVREKSSSLDTSLDIASTFRSVDSWSLCKNSAFRPLKDLGIRFSLVVKTSFSVHSCCFSRGTEL